MDILPGDEITVNYNEAVGYDKRKDPGMRVFLRLCAELGVEKRPSVFNAAAAGDKEKD